MDNRRWWLLAGALPPALGCALAAADPGLRPLGDAAVALAGLSASVLIWVVAGRRGSVSTAWRLIALAPLLPVLGLLLAVVVDPPTPLELVAFRWVPTVPGYALAVVGILGLAGRRPLRTGGVRVAIEMALFFTACLLVVPLLVLEPLYSWPSSDPAGHVILQAAVIASSATMAAPLTLLGVIESRRRAMALVLLVGTISLALGRGMATASLLTGAATGMDASRFLVVGGLSLLVAAVLMDPGPTEGADGADPAVGAAGRSPALRALLPHAAMTVAAAAVGGAIMAGARLDPVTYVGVVLTTGLAAAHRWVSARDEQRTDARLRRSEAWFRSLVSSGSDAVVLLDADLRVSWASPALARALGPAAAALTGRRLLEAVHPDDAEPLAAALSATAATDAPRSDALVSLRLRDAGEEWRWLEAGVTDLLGDPAVGAVVLHCRDVTERHDREERLRSLAYTDPRTGMPNRAGLLRAVERMLQERGDSPGDGVALLLLQLQGLSEAREHARLETVNAVVTEVGRRLRATVREEDLVARMGGGTFGILAQETGTEADQLADRCLAVVEQPIVTPDGVVDLSAAVGVAAVEPADEVSHLMGRAELALRAAGAAGPGTASRYRPALGEAAARQERLRTDLPAARSRRELTLQLQPIVSLEEQRVTGVEARLRWRHHELGDIPAAEFLPIAERLGLVADLQRFALEEAMRSTAGLPSAGAPPLRLGVDVPAGWAAGGTLLADVEAALRRTGFEPERLVLELAEDTVLSGDERVRLDLTALRLMGVHVALDDFGAGHSSLASLTRMPIDILKLDRSFVARLDRDPQSRALCESVVGIGRALGLDVVAEGVETPAQLAAVQAFGAGFAQGFLIARPMPGPDLARLMVERNGVLWPGLVGSR